MYDLSEFEPLKGYETFYLINKNGDILSLPLPNRNYYHKLSTKVNYRSGYVEVTLCVCNDLKTKLLHRLLAIQYIDNPNNYPVVNHKNGIKTDNRLDNLEWCTRKQNTKHAFDNNISNFREDVLNNLNKINYNTSYIIVILDNSVERKIFHSSKDASEYLNTDVDNITRAIRKPLHICGYNAYGYKRKDLEQFANGEPLPDVLKGIPWESYLNDNQSCNDYPSEGE